MRTKNVNEEFIEKNPINPGYQIIFIIISAISMSSILYYSLNQINILDEQPSIEKITPQKYKALGGFPSEIITGLHINKFEIFDIVKNQFLVECIIWFKYITGSISLKTLELFSFNRGEIIKKSAPEMYIDNQYMVVRYNIKVKFSSNLNYKNFPVNSHRIYLGLINDFLAPREVQFKGEEQLFTIDQHAVESGWKIFDKHVTTGFEKAEFDENSKTINEQDKSYPITIFSFDVKRAGARHLITIFLPLLVIFYISFFGLSVRSGTLRLGVMGMSAVIGYRFVIENISPNSPYFMVSDYIFFLFLFAEMAVFSLIILRLYTSTIRTFHAKIIIAATHLIVIGLSFYILRGL